MQKTPDIEPITIKGTLDPVVVAAISRQFSFGETVDKNTTEITAPTEQIRDCILSIMRMADVEILKN